MIYVISFHRFEPIIAKDLTADEVRRVKAIKETMSNDEYAGYSQVEQKKVGDILDIVRNKMVPTAKI